MATKRSNSMSEGALRRTAELAYAIWESEGRPHGRDREHWLRAESELGQAVQAASATTATAKAAKSPTQTTARKGTAREAHAEA